MVHLLILARPGLQVFRLRRPPQTFSPAQPGTRDNAAPRL